MILIYLVYIIYLGFIALIFFAIYKMVDNWVNKSLTVRREQNSLLKELVDVLKERKEN